MWENCKLDSILRDTFRDDILYLYRDPAYTSSYRILGPYRATGKHPLTPHQQALNVKMSSYRIVVEWGFGNILNQFTAAEWKHNHKTGKSPVALNYMISVLLYNCQTCLRASNQISDRFGNLVSPPTLETYLACKLF